MFHFLLLFALTFTISLTPSTRSTATTVSTGIVPPSFSVRAVQIFPPSETFPVPARLEISSVTTPSMPTTRSTFVFSVSLFRKRTANGRVKKQKYQRYNKKQYDLNHNPCSAHGSDQSNKRPTCKPDRRKTKCCCFNHSKKRRVRSANKPAGKL